LKKAGKMLVETKGELLSCRSDRVHSGRWWGGGGGGGGGWGLGFFGVGGGVWGGCEVRKEEVTERAGLRKGKGYLSSSSEKGALSSERKLRGNQ